MKWFLREWAAEVAVTLIPLAVLMLALWGFGQLCLWVGASDGI